MRQAGRYLPAYQDVRKKYSLQEMFGEPEIVAQVTCQPVGYLNVDAAILFADILTLPAAMGFDIRFDNKHGPIIGNPIQAPSDVQKVHDFDRLAHIETAIKLTNQKLPVDVPLIGFAGSPFTLACYLIDGGSSLNFSKTFRFLLQHPDKFHALLKKLTENTVRYFKMQQGAGIKAFQVFDTWGGIMSRQEYLEFGWPYVQEIFKSVNIPSIYYLKNACHLMKEVVRIEADFISVCQTVDFADNGLLKESGKGIQGNLHNVLLYADYDFLEKETLKILEAARSYKKYIFNLSHGVFPDVEPDKLRFISELVHRFPWRNAE